MLFAAKLRDLYPQEIVLWGVQPVNFEIGLELSPAVEAQVEPLVKNICEELKRWNLSARPK
jgi:hydrogenase maturation protease